MLRLYAGCFTAERVIGQIIWGWFYDPSVLSDICMWLVLRSVRVNRDIIFGWFTKPARYQTYVQILSVDNDFSCMR
jgi:hypothetical protein